MKREKTHPVSSPDEVGAETSTPLWVPSFSIASTWKGSRGKGMVAWKASRRLSTSTDINHLHRGLAQDGVTGPAGGSLDHRLQHAVGVASLAAHHAHTHRG